MMVWKMLRRAVGCGYKDKKVRGKSLWDNFFFFSFSFLINFFIGVQLLWNVVVVFAVRFSLY